MKKKFLLTSAFISSLFLLSCGGDDDYEEYEYSGFHYQGEACSQCHGTNAVEMEYRFNIGGTVFKILNAQNGDVNNSAYGYYVVLETQTGETYKTNIGRGTGNFWLNLAISSPFIPKVYDNKGQLVNKASTYHQASYTDCNSCHTATGKNGAPGRVVSYDYYASNTNQDNNQNSNINNPPTISSFTANPTSGEAPLQVSFNCSAYDTDGGISEYKFDFNSDGTIDNTNTTGIVSYTYTISGTYTAKCIAVDNQGQTATKTITINVNSNTNNNTPTPLTFTNDISPILDTKCSSCHNANNASGGLDVSDYNSVITRVDTANPENSLLLQKATGVVSHGGGAVLQTNSPEYQTILNWIQQGANQ